MQRRTVLAGLGIVGVAGTIGTVSARPAEALSLPLRNLLTVSSLSHVNDPERTPIFPGDPEFVLETATTVAADGYYLQYVREGEHTGSHWGAPAHFQEGGRTADQLTVDDLFLPAVRIDIRERASADPDYAISIDDLIAFEGTYGPIPPESAVIAWTGWDERWGTPDYVNADAAGVSHQPGFSTDAVQWLIDRGTLGERGALGIDTFGPDRGVDETYQVSTMLFDRRRISLENLTNLQALPPTGGCILVGSTINRNGSGAPGAIYAITATAPR